MKCSYNFLLYFCSKSFEFSILFFFSFLCSFWQPWFILLYLATGKPFFFFFFFLLQKWWKFKLHKTMERKKKRCFNDFSIWGNEVWFFLDWNVLPTFIILKFISWKKNNKKLKWKRIKNEIPNIWRIFQIAIKWNRNRNFSLWKKKIYIHL